MNPRMNLIIDGQIMQTDAWHRGMGKYTIQVLTELSRYISDNLQFTLLFNTNIRTDSQRFETIKYLCPNIKQVKTSLPVPSDKPSLRETIIYRNRLSQFIDTNWTNHDNFYLLTSLFFFDFFAELPINCNTGILFYDLTPLLFWQELGGYFPPDLYMPRFQTLLDANKIFCISETTRGDVLRLFGLNPKNVININGGFTKISEKTIKPKNITVPKKFILFPTGDIPHKNNEIAIKGFQQFCEENASSITLLITSNFSLKSKKRLFELSDNIIFTGNVNDEELEWLYEHAEAVLFTSKYEGLGMPILDAVATKKPIITSKIPVFEEMSKSAFYYFDPNNPAELKDTINDALLKKEYKQKLKYYPVIMKKFTWVNTTNKIIDELTFKHNKLVEQSNLKTRIAVACLNPGIENQIGRIAEKLYYSLNQKFIIEFYFDAGGYHYKEMERPTFLDFINTKSFDITKLNLSTYIHYDCIIYLLDDKSILSRVAQKAAILPGIVIEDNLVGINAIAEMMRKLIYQTQYKCLNFNGNTYDSYQKLTSELLEHIKNKNNNRSEAENIIRSKSSYGSIIKRLKALSK